MNMSTLREATIVCADYLRTVKSDTQTDDTFTADVRYHNWLKAVYHDPTFLYAGNYMGEHEALEDKPESELTLDETRSLITYMIRAMRHQYGEFPCIKDGSLLRLLECWLELTKEEGY